VAMPAARPPYDNVVLIGMPGVGKSTIGILLAKQLSLSFIDTDVYIQAREGRRLQEIIDGEGLAAFRAAEERHLLTLNCRGFVIATGGSVVYSDAAMHLLKTFGPVIHLFLPLPVLERRVTDLGSRGVVIEPGQTFARLYEERQPFYARYADIGINCAGLNHEACVAAIVQALDNRFPGESG
jgi:shikimate kinase